MMTMAASLPGQYLLKQDNRKRQNTLSNTQAKKQPQNKTPKLKTVNHKPRTFNLHPLAFKHQAWA